MLACTREVPKYGPGFMDAAWSMVRPVLERMKAAVGVQTYYTIAVAQKRPDFKQVVEDSIRAVLIQRTVPVD